MSNSRITPLKTLKTLSAEKVDIDEASTLPDDLFAFVLSRQLWRWTRHISFNHPSLVFPRAEMSFLMVRLNDGTVRPIAWQTHTDSLLTMDQFSATIREAEQLARRGGSFLSSGYGSFYQDCPMSDVVGFSVRVCVHTRS